MKGTYLITAPERKMPAPGAGGPGGAPAGGPQGGPPQGGPGGPGGPGGAPTGGPQGGPPQGGPGGPGGAPAGGPQGGPPQGGPGGPGGAPAGGPQGGPPAGGAGGGMQMPTNSETKLVWDGEKAVWTNEMGEETVLEQCTETDGELKFVAMAGPAPIEWTITKTADGYTAVSHRGADIHGNPPVDTECKVVRQ